MFKIDEKIVKISEECMSLIKDQFLKIDSITEYNQQKVLKAFIDTRVSESHFISSTGYGYGDKGREKIDEVYAKVFGAEDALVRHNFVSGTHALTVALFGILRPGDTLLSVTGAPYDTMQSVIGTNGNKLGSLKDFNIKYDQVDLKEDGTLNYDGISDKINVNTKVVYIQRSRGYTLRKSLFCSEINKIQKLVKNKFSDCVIILDNCYGEFVEKIEPTQVGVDLVIGSLIKNPGGGIAPTGGYIAGRSDLVEKCSYRLTTPGTGKEIGATLGLNRDFFMGIFNAPHVTGEALKTAVFASAFFEKFGFEVSPRYNDSRADIVQVLKLKNSDALIRFCQGIQKGSPIDSFVSPNPWNMPGYDGEIIMAAGTFTLGSSIELSADAPLREPYAVWLQGSLNFHSGKIGVMIAAQEMLERGYLDG